MQDKKPYAKPEIQQLDSDDPRVKLIMQEIGIHFPIIHILKGGFPLCGFSLHLPEKWPPDHKWISYLDPQVHKATCDDCKTEFEKDRS
jgi:hypothetical protein